MAQYLAQLNILQAYITQYLSQTGNTEVIGIATSWSNIFKNKLGEEYCIGV